VISKKKCKRLKGINESRHCIIYDGEYVVNCQGFLARCISMYVFECDRSYAYRYCWLHMMFSYIPCLEAYMPCFATQAVVTYVYECN
jgi:hypothetical protein